jgi:hypothetical protein
MANISNALPAPEPGGNPQSQPDLSLVPPDKSRRTRDPAALTRAEQKEVTLTQALCAAGLLPEFAAGLLKNKVTAAFLTALQTDADTVQRTGQEAVNSTHAKEGCTAGEAEAKAQLMADLRTIQSAARAEFGDTQPERVKNYHVGNDIDESRETLEAASQSIINQANNDRPGEVNTDFIIRTNNDRTMYVSTNAQQIADLGTAKQKRRDRQEMIAAIRERRKKIQRAADAAWSHTSPDTAKQRTVFRLPAGRPYSY